MRLIGAGIFVFGGVLALVAFLGSQNMFEAVPPWAIGICISIFMFFLIGIALWLFNPKGSNPFGLKSVEDQIHELRELDLLESNEFHATRAFGVEEFEDEGLHYYIELIDGRVLFLSGQYLYDYEPISDDPEVNQPRLFPCTKFTILRHKKEKYVLDILCSENILEPEVVAPPFSIKDHRQQIVPEDGQVISDATYENLKRDRLG